MSDRARPLFVYGSLRVPVIMARVCGRLVQGTHARLPAHHCGPIRGERFPGLVPKQGSLAEGMLYTNLSTAELARIDAFEDDFYARRPVRVVTIEDELTVDADAYLVQPAHAALVEPEPWSLQRFIDEDLDAFAERFLGGTLR